MTKRKVNDKMDNNDIIIDAAGFMMYKIILGAAVQCIGQKIIPDIDKPYITDEISTIISDSRDEKKDIITKIMNRIRNIKISTNFNITPVEI